MNPMQLGRLRAPNVTWKSSIPVEHGHMTKMFAVSALSFFAMLGCGSEAGYEQSEGDADQLIDNGDGTSAFEKYGEHADQLIDNGDGTFAFPESWERSELVVEATELVDKIGPSSADVRSGVGPSLFSKNFLYTLTLSYTGAPSGPITSILVTFLLDWPFLCVGTRPPAV
jgi:hypothetical protein